MKIVLLAPNTSQKNTIKEYQMIADVCKKLKHTVNADYIHHAKDAKEMEKKYKNVMNEIKEADVVVAEATTLTVDVSRLITFALQYHIPTLVLYRDKSPESFVFESSRLLLLKHYSPSNLEEVIKTHLKKINRKKLIYRFNLMLSKELGSFVMDRSKENRVSKADYIRQLIVDDMEKTS
jgi:hypothetical protein